MPRAVKCAMAGEHLVRGRVRVAMAAALIVAAGATSPATAQSDPSSIDLIVDAGRPLRVELDQRIRLQRVGQVVTGTVREPVYGEFQNPQAFLVRAAISPGWCRARPGRSFLLMLATIARLPGPRSRHGFIQRPNALMRSRFTDSAGIDAPDAQTRFGRLPQCPR